MEEVGENSKFFKQRILVHVEAEKDSVRTAQGTLSNWVRNRGLF